MFLKVCIISIVLIMEDLAAVDAYALEYSCMSYSAGMLLMLLIVVMGVIIA